MYKIDNIRDIHLEITQKCQAACPMCDRNQNGGDLNPHINLDELSLDDCKKIFTPSFISQLDSLNMCGNLGDPIIASDTLEVFDYLRQHNNKIWLGMNTNAGARDNDWWRDLAKVFGDRGTVTFSVDGLQDTNHLYRQNVKWDKVENSMDAFISSGGSAKWDFLVFEHNQHQVEQAEKLSKQKGFKKFVAKKTGRFVTTTSEAKQSHQAINPKGQPTTNLQKPDEKYQNKALQIQKSIIEKYGSMDEYYDVTPVVCKVTKNNSLFISAEGLALPCCWTAGRMYKWWQKDPKVEQIWQFIDRAGGKEMLDAKQGLEKVFDTGIFDDIAESWNKKSCADGKLKVCAIKCGAEWDPYTEQFR